MISVIIPTYCQASKLPALVDELTGFLSELYDCYEVVIVDDGSIDETEDVLCDLCKDYEQLKGIVFARNFGQQHATLAGLRASQYKLVLTLDDDFNYALEDVKRLLGAVEEDYDLCYLIPRNRERILFREWGTRFKEFVFCVFLRKPRAIQLTSTRLIKAPMIEWLCLDESPRVYLSARALQKTRHIGQVKSLSKVPQQATRYTKIKLIGVLWNAFKYYGPLSRFTLKKFKQSNAPKAIQYIIKAVYP